LVSGAATTSPADGGDVNAATWARRRAASALSSSTSAWRRATSGAVEPSGIGGVGFRALELSSDTE